MVDHFAEINFVHSDPKVGDVRKIEVSGLDFNLENIFQINLRARKFASKLVLD